MICILEDDDSIRKLVVYALKNQGYEVRGYETPSVFWAELHKGMCPKLLLLDIMLPEEDGISILKKLKRDPTYANLPIVMLTAKSAEYDRVEGLDTGADDYIVKPFGMMELMARVRAILRRCREFKDCKVYKNGCLELLPERHEVKVNGKDVPLTYKEFQLLCLLSENEGIVLDRSKLLDRIWDLGAEPENRTLDVHIRTLRSKLGEAGKYIETIRGIGYRMKQERA